MVDLLVNVALPFSLYLERKTPSDGLRSFQDNTAALDFVVWAGQDSGMDADIGKITSVADITLGGTHMLRSESHACVVPLPESLQVQMR